MNQKESYAPMMFAAVLGYLGALALIGLVLFIAHHWK
jgi:hypothetical protein